MCCFEQYDLSCPICGAQAEFARLEIVRGEFDAQKLMLSENGFNLSDAGQYKTNNEIVYCHACKRTFDLHRCRDDGLAYTETIEIRGVRDMSEGALVMQTEILGTPMNLTLLRVKDCEDIQVVDGDNYARDRYNDLCKMDPGGKFHTTRLAGKDGEWVMILTPFQR